MPEIVIDLDESTYSKLKKAAKAENLSLSTYVVRTLQESMHSKWSADFEDLYGSINDETFIIEKAPRYNFDSRREESILFQRK